jgi:hypothetical protein
MAGRALHCQKNETAINHAHRLRLQKLYLPREKLASESHAGKSSFSQFLTRFLYGRWRHKAPKARFGCKTFYFMRKSSWGISEPPGVFCIEQAQKIIGGSKPAPWRCGLFIVLVMQGPARQATFTKHPGSRNINTNRAYVIEVLLYSHKAFQTEVRKWDWEFSAKPPSL